MTGRDDSEFGFWESFVKIPCRLCRTYNVVSTLYDPGRDVSNFRDLRFREKVTVGREETLVDEVMTF